MAIIRPRVLLELCRGPGNPLLLLSVISQSSLFLFHFLHAKGRKTDPHIHGFSATATAARNMSVLASTVKWWEKPNNHSGFEE
jgi:hypothetical protein